VSDQLHVGYILKQYPRLSETFILNEILGVEHAGAHVTIFSLRHATEGRFHPELASVRGEVHYLPTVDKAAFLSAIQALPNLNTDQLAEVLDFVDLLPAERQARILLHAVEVADRVRVSRIDHLHAHFLTIAAQTAHIVHLLTGVPYTVTAHAKDIYRHTVDWGLAQRIARHATAVITVCDSNLEHLVPRLGHGVRVQRIYNGLGPQQPPARLADRTKHLVVGVGRLVEKKGFDLLLLAVAMLANDLPDLRCVLVGDGDQRHALETLTYQLGIADRVCFTGSLPQPQVERWLRRAHVVAAPCRIGDDGNQDALPTVLLEALGAGVPTVATQIAGIPEIIEHNVEGIVIPADDVGALAAGFAALMRDDVRWAELSLAGPKKLAKRFDREATIRDLVAIFDSASTKAARTPIGIAG
jgi:colanic acid/amylovoran biosynthesis glycosyltransferase